MKVGFSSTAIKTQTFNASQGKLPPTEVWRHLSTAQQQAVYQAFVTVSRQLLMAPKGGRANEQP
jgi:hypothetical protein